MAMNERQERLDGPGQDLQTPLLNKIRLLVTSVSSSVAFNHHPSDLDPSKVIGPVQAQQEREPGDNKCK